MRFTLFLGFKLMLLHFTGPSIKKTPSDVMTLTELFWQTSSKMLADFIVAKTFA